MDDQEAKMTMYALVSESGTAMSVTALCGEHITYQPARLQAREWARHEEHVTDDPWDGGDFHDCTGNEALSCQQCGAT